MKKLFNHACFLLKPTYIVIVYTLSVLMQNVESLDWKCHVSRNCWLELVEKKLMWHDNTSNKRRAQLIRHYEYLSIFIEYNNWWYQSKIALEFDILTWPISQGQNPITFWVWHTISRNDVASFGLGKPRGDLSPKLGKTKLWSKCI
jgi:hypothetical protein